jgi:hypothetical protein
MYVEIQQKEISQYPAHRQALDVLWGIWQLSILWDALKSM